MAPSPVTALLLNFPLRKALSASSPQVSGASFAHSLGRVISGIRCTSALAQELGTGPRVDYDFIFISLECFGDAQVQLLARIQRGFPCAGLFIVTAQKNYALALHALRSGVRDLVQLPLKLSELQLVLAEDALTHRPLRGDLGFLGVLQVFGDMGKFATPGQIYHRIQDYMSEQFRVKAIAIFRYHHSTQTGGWSFGQPSGVKFLPDELFALAQGEQEYVVKNSWVCRVLFRAKEITHCLVFELPEVPETPASLATAGDLRPGVGAGFDHFFAVLCPLVKNCHEYLEQHQSAAKMSSLAHTDDVTGLFNQRKLLQDIDRSMLDALQHQGHFSLVFLDLDHFKHVNDDYGHVIGSKLLTQVAAVIRQVIRETDYIYRYGGDEFIILLPGVRAQNAKKIGERLLAKMQHQEFVVGDEQKFKLGLSLGIAEYPRDAESREEILSMADKLMYEAKKSGRGKIRFINRRIPPP